MSEPLANAKDIAQLLNVKPSTVYEWARTKYIPCVPIGGCIRFDRTEVDKWLREKRRAGRKTRLP